MAKVNKSYLMGVDISENDDFDTIVMVERRKNEEGTIIPVVVNTIYGPRAKELYEELITPPKKGE